MSNRRRPRRSSEPWPQPGPSEAYVNQPAVALDRHAADSVDLARTGSHDSLISQLGPRRRSGIWWTHHYPGEASKFLDDMYDLATMAPREVEIVAEIRAAMRNPSALLVVAWCIGEVPEGVSLA